MWTLIKVWLLCQLCCYITVDAASPVFTKPPSGTGSAQAIAENKVVGSTIIDLEATDTDGDLLKFTVVSQSPPSPEFQINSKDELVVPPGLDYETIKLFSFKFRVSDSSSSDETMYNLTVLDVDDESPVFIKTNISVTISETVQKGSSVTTVTATDKDSKSIQYNLEGSQKTFAIDHNGVITINDPADLAIYKGNVLTLQVTASDGTNPVGTTSVLITVLEGPCSGEKCKNGGTCQVTSTTYKCNCFDGYTGDHCESVDYCYDKPCQNNRTCTSKYMQYTCECGLCFKDQNCSTPHNPCKHGKCQDDGCKCNDNYKGKYCDKVMPVTEIIVAIVVSALLLAFTPIIFMVFCCGCWCICCNKCPNSKQKGKPKCTCEEDSICKRSCECPFFIVLTLYLGCCKLWRQCRGSKKSSSGMCFYCDSCSYCSKNPNTGAEESEDNRL